MNILKFPEIRKRLIFTLIIITVFRILAHIPVPGVDVSAIKSFIQSNTLLGFYDLFSGGGFQNFSIVTLGLGAYINVSIIVQMLTIMIPSLEEMMKEGESGREKINTYTRLFTVPMSIFQAYGIYFLLSQQKVIGRLIGFDLIIFLFTLMAGSLLMVWLGELVTEYGIGNGISLLIFVGIISRLPVSVVNLVANFGVYNLINLLLFTVLSLAVIIGVVLVNEGTRNIVIEYGRRGFTSQKIVNYLPIKINQAGVIPIIFAVSVVMIPSMIAGPFQASNVALLQQIGSRLSTLFQQNTVGYNIFYFLLVVGFTYFYTSISFNPQKVAEDIKKRGGFVPGIRPGTSTTKYLTSIVTKITLAGALFLGLIAILPYLMQTYLGMSSLAIGGTSLLIVVSVVLETVRQIESMTVTKSYNSYLG